MAPQVETNLRETTVAPALLWGLTELSARASHDLVGPLNQAASLLALFVNRYGMQLGPEADELLGFLQRTSARMESVASGVRTYLEIASRPPSFGPVDLNVSLAFSLELLGKEISESGAVIGSESLPMVSADSAHMVKIFEVLIGNSIKFRKPDAVPRIQIVWKQIGETRYIEVADNGIGIDPEYRDIAFLPFKRLNGTKYPGAGLGLATAKLITEMNGCHIRMSSRPESEPQRRGDHSDGTQVQFTVRPE